MHRPVIPREPVAWQSVYRIATGGPPGDQWPRGPAILNTEHWRGLVVRVRGVDATFASAWLLGPGGGNGGTVSLAPTQWDAPFSGSPPALWLPSDGPMLDSIQLFPTTPTGSGSPSGGSIGGEITAYYSDHDYGPLPCCIPSCMPIALRNDTVTVPASGSAQAYFWWVGPVRVLVRSGTATNMLCQLQTWTYDAIAGNDAWAPITQRTLTAVNVPVVFSAYALGAMRVAFTNGEATGRGMSVTVTPDAFALAQSN